MTDSNKGAERWKKVGPRFFRISGNSKFFAEIFGAPAPTQRWAWCVYGANISEEGIENSLASARKNANKAIQDAIQEFAEL